MSISLSRSLDDGFSPVPARRALGGAEASHRLSALPPFVQRVPGGAGSGDEIFLRECFRSGGVYYCGWTVDSRAGKPEVRMIKSAIKLATLTMFSMALIASPPSVPAFAAGGGGDPPASAMPPPPVTRSAPRSTSKSTSRAKKKADKQSSVDDAAFRAGYRTAHATIYERNDYAGAIEQLKALGHDDNAGVANLIGYSYRKLGDYRISQIWYERALKADPKHVLTWQYYGLWQIEQGNRDQASYHLSRIAAICGTGCEEYRSLAAALEKPPGTGLVY
jgi:hypothetical protein